MINIWGFFKLSTKLVPIKPQKNTSETLPIKIAIINFLNCISDKEDAILIKNAGVKGIAISKTKKDKLILSIFCILRKFDIEKKQRNNLDKLKYMI